MDRTALVTYRIDEGKQFLDRLIADGLDVSVAFWMYTNDNERWGLYVVSKSMDQDGPVEPYMKVVLALRAMPELRIELHEAYLLEPSRPLARGMVRFARGLPAGKPGWVETRMVNDVYVELAYVYPASMPEAAGAAGGVGPGVQA